MITEDYVSFETAKLLKEKGFDEGCRLHYHYEEAFNKYFPTDKSISGFEQYYYPCPTLQMTMKWLREEHNIAINIGWGEVFEEDYRWWCVILDQKSGEILQDSEYYKTYEEACEAAIKYCLEHLI